MSDGVSITQIKKGVDSLIKNYLPKNFPGIECFVSKVYRNGGDPDRGPSYVCLTVNDITYKFKANGYFTENDRCFGGWGVNWSKMKELFLRKLEKDLPGGNSQKQKRPTDTKMILDIIEKNKTKLESLPDTIIQIEKRDISCGDEWDSEEGYEYLIFFADKSAYLVREKTVTEDRDNRVEPHVLKEYFCLDYYQERNIAYLEVFEKIEKVLLSTQKLNRD